MLKPQDIVVALHLVLHPKRTQTQTARALGLSQAEISKALQRLKTSQLLLQDARRVVVPNLAELCTHGLRYIFPAELGRTKGGVPTAALAPPLQGRVGGEDAELVWPHTERLARATSIEPLHPCVPGAALTDPELHELLALLEGIRAGKARIRRVSVELFTKKLKELSSGR